MNNHHSEMEFAHYHITTYACLETNPRSDDVRQLLQDRPLSSPKPYHFDHTILRLQYHPALHVPLN